MMKMPEDLPSKKTPVVTEPEPEQVRESEVKETEKMTTMTTGYPMEGKIPMEMESENRRNGLLDRHPLRGLFHLRRHHRLYRKTQSDCSVQDDLPVVVHRHGHDHGQTSFDCLSFCREKKGIMR